MIFKTNYINWKKHRKNKLNLGKVKGKNEVIGLDQFDYKHEIKAL